MLPQDRKIECRITGYLQGVEGPSDAFELRFILGSEATHLWEARRLKTAQNTYMNFPGNKHGKYPRGAMDWGWGT